MGDTSDKFKRQLLEIFEEWEEDNKRAARSRGRAVDQINSILTAVADPHSINPHLAAYEKFGPSNVPVILFMDIVGYSKLSFDKEQKEAIELLNSVVRAALKAADCKLEEVVCLPTGDGMCLCFVSGTDTPVKVAAGVQMILAKENRKRAKTKSSKKRIKVRMGIHLGNVLRIEDLKGSFNLAGAALNLTQRAMDCGNEDHILCTQDAYKQLIRIDKEYKLRLTRLPEFTVKHGVRLKLYNYCHPQDGVGNHKDPRE